MDLKAKIGTLVAGSIIAVAGLGAVTPSAQADTNVTVSNSCDDCESETGNAAAQNNSATFVGQNNASGTNVQQGDNEADVEQSANASSGDAVSGQAVGVVGGGSGDTNVNASNTCDDCKSSSGDAFAQNNAIMFVGLNTASGTNIQDGDNEADVDQGSYVNSGDGVSGQIVGVVTG
jgi:hypothetical protein